MVTRRHRPGFTLIELIVVVTIIGILVGLILGGINVVRRQAAKTRTNGILAMVANALASSGATKAQNLGLVEHPLAGSAPTRFIFVRAADGTAVNPAGDAIRASDPAYVTSGTDRLLRDDDVFADPLAPQFFGVPRWRLTTIGASTKWVSSWLRVSGPGQAGSRVEPDLGTWQYEGFIRISVTDPIAVDWDNSANTAFSVAMGSAMDELASIGAIKRPDPTRDTLILGNRLRQDLSPGAKAPSATWFPGTVLVNGLWTPYRMRGPTIIDAWGNEILISRAPSGALRLESAGPDGVFRWNPGPNGVLNTDPRATSPAGDDLDGSTDNITLGPEN